MHISIRSCSIRCLYGFLKIIYLNKIEFIKQQYFKNHYIYLGI